MGDYDLLPRQEELLGQLVEAYLTDGCTSFMVFAAGSGGNIIWSDCHHNGFNHDSMTLVNDLHQLSVVGLLSYVRPLQSGAAEYQITKASIDAVKNDFQISSNVPSFSQNQSLPKLDFSFVISTEHRAIIERDYEEVQKCVSGGAFKAAMVVCGSIVEALLLERLSTETSKAKTSAAKLGLKHHNDPLEKWELFELVEVASDIGVLDSESKPFADQLRNYRNVIHPGLEIRMSFEPSVGKAQAAFTLLTLIVEKF